MGINGFRFRHIGNNPEISGLLNESVFFTVNDKWTLGLESNLEVYSSHTTVAIFPQVHREISKTVSVQFGVGMAQTTTSKLRPTAALRLIKTL